ncbi:hypothetical protein [Mycobacterium shigaense]|uniref:Uncharacterized protein n=1 Tax=Mycobacterium shigaense TaxID=722731 RepID=A0A1Z4EGN1_9MYCO|nr:hypothetical protein [Mycobacterium shigaense]MEA1122834.1 hypothetical protein [Mycobacterium shigaense]PRI13236.1 hypothetical protein B2J96_20795 [Mycobacterium shigaense]BAX92123.1 hypothetical protein MSG_01974 [Mycobacterium shigaense]
MTNVRKVTRGVVSAGCAAGVVAAAGAAVGSVVAHADPAGHQVTYTVSSPNNLTATVNYVSSDPPSQAAYNADPSKFTTSVQAPLSGGTPVTYTATLANPNQYASISASGMLHWPDSGNGPAQFHCEIAVDGQVVVHQDATTTVTCRLG